MRGGGYALGRGFYDMMIRVGTKPQCRVYRVTIYMVKVRELRVMVMHTYVV